MYKFRGAVLCLWMITLFSTILFAGNGMSFSNAKSFNGHQSYYEYLNRGEVNYFKYTPNEDGILKIKTTGQLDMYGTLYFPDGTKQAEDDIAYPENKNFKFENIKVDTGKTYYIEVKGYNEYVSGGYNIGITFTPAPKSADDFVEVSWSSGIYRNNVDTVKLLTVPGNNVNYINVLVEGNTEKDFDTVTIIDENFKRIATLSGQNIHERMTVKGKNIFIHFKSDGSNTDTGVRVTAHIYALDLIWDNFLSEADVGDILLFNIIQECDGSGDGCYYDTGTNALGQAYGYFSHAAIITKVDQAGGTVEVFHARGKNSSNGSSEDEVGKDTYSLEDLRQIYPKGSMMILRVKNTTHAIRRKAVEDGVAKYNSYRYIHLANIDDIGEGQTYCSALVRDIWKDQGYTLDDKDEYKGNSFIRFVFTPDELLLSENLEHRGSITF